MTKNEMIKWGDKMRWFLNLIQKMIPQMSKLKKERWWVTLGERWWGDIWYEMMMVDIWWDDDGWHLVRWWWVTFGERDDGWHLVTFGERDDGWHLERDEGVISWGELTGERLWGEMMGWYFGERNNILL